MESVTVFGVLVALVGIFGITTIAFAFVCYKVWRENPGIIMKSFYPGPDRDPRIRSTTQVASSSAPPHSEGNAIATVPRSKSTIKLEATAVGAAAASPATVDATPLQPSTSRTALGGNSQAQTARRRSVTSTTQLPVMDEHIPFDWEIDPKKLRLKYAIGKGNFGEVWLATWLGSPVAVKTIVPELQNKEKLVKRFIDEILLMSMLHHPNVVLFLGACTKRPNLCLVLEYCVHGSLHHFLKTEQEHGIRITMSLIYRFALDIARGVYYLHRRCKVVQRDLKARNILVDESLNAKVADFGLSRVMDESEKNKLTACGTPAWTAPEIVKMEAYTEKVDVYSFGIIMWELITRQEPYGGQKGVQIAYAAAEQGLRPDIPDYCPPDYADLMRRCWANDPNDRPEFNTILKQLFQLKKNCDIVAAAAGPPHGEGGHHGDAAARAVDTHRGHRPSQLDDIGDDDSGDDAFAIGAHVGSPPLQRPPGPKVHISTINRAPSTRAATAVPSSSRAAAAASSAAAAAGGGGGESRSPAPPLSLAGATTASQAAPAPGSPNRVTGGGVRVSTGGAHTPGRPALHSMYSSGSHGGGAHSPGRFKSSLSASSTKSNNSDKARGPSPKAGGGSSPKTGVGGERVATASISAAVAAAAAATPATNTSTADSRRAPKTSSAPTAPVVTPGTTTTTNRFAAGGGAAGMIDVKVHCGQGHAIVDASRQSSGAARLPASIAASSFAAASAVTTASATADEPESTSAAPASAADAIATSDTCIVEKLLPVLVHASEATTISFGGKHAKNVPQLSLGTAPGAAVGIPVAPPDLPGFVLTTLSSHSVDAAVVGSPPDVSHVRNNTPQQQQQQHGAAGGSDHGVDSTAAVKSEWDGSVDSLNTPGIKKSLPTAAAALAATTTDTGNEVIG